MKAERQHKEAISRVIQPSKGGGGRIVDDRQQSKNQANMIDLIQKKDNNINHQNDVVPTCSIDKTTQLQLKPPCDLLCNTDRVIQRLVQKDKLNVVGEAHDYTTTTRNIEKGKVESILGEGSYLVEDSPAFSSYPLFDETENTDYEGTFLSKGDAPYYLICQGLGFIVNSINDFVSTHDKRILYVIDGFCNKIETEVDRGMLQKVQYSDEEYNYVYAYDIFLSTPKEYMPMQILMDLQKAARIYKKVIEDTYVYERGKFEVDSGITKAGIDKMDLSDTEKLIKKRSYSMAMHIKEMDKQEKKGVIKVGRYHLEDFRLMEDFPDKTRLSDMDELNVFLQGAVK